MRTLKPTIEGGPAETKLINSNHVYILITDYGRKKILRHILIEPGLSTWHWISMEESISIDLRPGHYQIRSFDAAINRAINDLYCTVYEFAHYKDMVISWENIKYIDDIKRIYKEDKESLPLKENGDGM